MKSKFFVFQLLFFCVLLSSCTSDEQEQNLVDPNIGPYEQQLINAAENGDVEAQYELAVLFNKKDETMEMSKFWLEQAASNNHVIAQLKMGEYNKYLNHKHYQSQNEELSKKAFDWFSKAAEQNNEDAQYRVAEMSLYDPFYSKTYAIEEVMGLYEKAARGGSIEAQFSLAKNYSSNHLGENIQDQDKAIFWYEVASERGHADAQYALGALYFYGTPEIQIDKKKGFEWLLKSAQQKNPSAMSDIGRAYYYGDFIEKNEEEGVKWLNMAKDNNAEAKSFLEYLDKKNAQ